MICKHQLACKIIICNLYYLPLFIAAYRQPCLKSAFFLQFYISRNKFISLLIYVHCVYTYKYKNTRTNKFKTYFIKCIKSWQIIFTSKYYSYLFRLILDLPSNDIRFRPPPPGWSVRIQLGRLNKLYSWRQNSKASDRILLKQILRKVEDWKFLFDIKYTHVYICII